VSYLSALEVCSRQGAIQIHIYLYLTFTLPPSTARKTRIFPQFSGDLFSRHAAATSAPWALLPIALSRWDPLFIRTL